MRIEERQTEWAAQRTARGMETARWHKRGQPGEGRRGTSLPMVSFSPPKWEATSFARRGTRWR